MKLRYLIHHNYVISLIKVLYLVSYKDPCFCLQITAKAAVIDQNVLLDLLTANPQLISYKHGH